MAQNTTSKYETARRISNPPLSLRTTPSNDEFLSDSLLNDSKIPSPSPTRSGAGATARPRRAIGNTRTLKDAWEHSGKAKFGYASNSQIVVNSSGLKPATTQTQRRSTTPGRNRPGKSTPSPPRPNTAGSISSPYSDFSSPPKGLEDVYQRIRDEENLAAQEGELSEEDGLLEDQQRNLRDRSRLERIRRSASPMSLRGSRQNSPRSLSAMRDVEEADNKENVLEAETALSQPSGMSFLESMTDQVLAAKLTPHTLDRARDKARLEKALRQDSPMFEKYRSSREPLVEGNIHRRNSQEEENSTNGSSNGSVNSGRLDAPLNVPRNWGSRAKSQKGWLKRVYNPNGSTNNDNADSSQIDWTAAAADVALPTVEDSSSARGTSSTPTSIAPKRSLDRIRQLELNDFTAQSLQVSQSPPVRQRNTALDEIREREISSLEKQAVTTNRLGELRQKESQEQIQIPRSMSVGADQPVANDIKRAEERVKKTMDLEGNGEAIPDTPIVIYRAQRTANESSSDDAGKGNRHLNHTRESSNDSLRKLARAYSQSPRPSSSSEDWSLVEKDEKANAQGSKSANQFVYSQRASDNADSTEPVLKGQTLPPFAPTPVVTGAWQDTILTDDSKPETQQEAASKDLKTPRVTGAWIDTPLATNRKYAPLRSQTPVEEVDEEAAKTTERSSTAPQDSLGVQSHPNLHHGHEASQQQNANTFPRSALGALLDKAKLNREASNEDRNDTLLLGDVTIDSLEDLLTLDNTDMTTLVRLGAQLEAGDRQNEDAPPLGTEAELLDRLGSKLDRLRTNIHDARKGISNLERQVSHGDGQGGTNGQRPLRIGPCQTCGCPGGSTPTETRGWVPVNTPRKVYLTLPIPRVLNDRKSDQWLPRPTLLGFLALTITIWFLSEKFMCAYYCHPLYAEFYEWPSEPEPRPGVALPTMLWRWLIRPWLNPILSIFWPVIKAFGMMLGLWDGFVDDPRAKGPFAAGGGQLLGGGGGVDVGSGPELSMTNDEYI